MRITSEILELCRSIDKKDNIFEHNYNRKLRDSIVTVTDKESKIILEFLYAVTELWAWEDNEVIFSNPVINLLDGTKLDFTIPSESLTNTANYLIENLECRFLIALICDTMWVLKKDSIYGHKALKSYICHAEEIFDSENWTTTFSALKRAYNIACSLGKSEKKDMGSYIHKVIVDVDGADSLFFSIKLIDTNLILKQN